MRMRVEKGAEKCGRKKYDQWGAHIAKMHWVEKPEGSWKGPYNRGRNAESLGYLITFFLSLITSTTHVRHTSMLCQSMPQMASLNVSDVPYLFPTQPCSSQNTKFELPSRLVPEDYNHKGS
jgi:hypothetical protein